MRDQQSNGKSTAEAIADDTVIQTNLPDLTRVGLKDVREAVLRLQNTPLGEAMERVIEDQESIDPVLAGFGSAYTGPATDKPADD